MFVPPLPFFLLLFSISSAPPPFMLPISLSFQSRVIGLSLMKEGRGPCHRSEVRRPFPCVEGWRTFPKGKETRSPSAGKRRWRRRDEEEGRKGGGEEGRGFGLNPSFPKGEGTLSQCKGEGLGPPSLSPMTGPPSLYIGEGPPPLSTMTRPPSLLHKGRASSPWLERKRNRKEKRRRRRRDEEEKKEEGEEDPSFPKRERRSYPNARGKGLGPSSMWKRWRREEGRK